MDYNFNDTPSQASHSIHADIATGWKPKLKIIGPMPLNFDNKYIDKAIKSIVNSQTSIYTVVYLGPRPTNTFHMHQIYAKKYKYKYSHLLHGDFVHLKSFFNKFYSQFLSEGKRSFVGMNPRLKNTNVIFDSSFESGNLDCAIKVRQNQYDLILRIDSNTAGHILWYYFKVKNQSPTKRRLKLNIINMRRNKSAYERGMKPFVKRSDNKQWLQQGENVEVSEERIRYNKQNLLLMALNQNYQAEDSIYRKLSFELDFEVEQEIQVAYCIPYTYSQLLTDIKNYKKITSNINNMLFDVDTSHETLSGLQIPVIKITQNNQTLEKKKYCIFCIGRQHPGQSNSSYVIKGIIQYLLSQSQEVKRIRQNCVFIFIPMLNPDGVVIGNFRTSLYGKDLNRLFKQNQTSLIPEISFSRELLFQNSKIHKNKFLLFLDIHGHSTRRNSFCFGPGILQANILSDIRYFPKIISSKTQVFRYPSCSFRINNDKKTTARALFRKYTGLSYTIQSSNWSYYSQKLGKMLDFTAEIWEHVGTSIGQAIQEYLLDKIQAKHKNIHKKIEVDLNKMSNKVLNDKKQRKINKSISIYQKMNKRPIKPLQKHQDIEIQLTQKRMKTEIKSEIKNHNLKEEFQRIDEKQQQNESDKMSEKGMDTDTEGQDMEEGKFKNYVSAASQMIIQFQKAYYGQSYKKQRENQKNRPTNKSKNLIFKEKKKIEVLACLRKKQAPSIELKDESNIKKIKLEKRTLDHEKHPFSQKNIHQKHPSKETLRESKDAMDRMQNLQRQRMRSQLKESRFQQMKIESLIKKQPRKKAQNTNQIIKSSLLKGQGIKPLEQNENIIKLSKSRSSIQTLDKIHIKQLYEDKRQSNLLYSKNELESLSQLKSEQLRNNQKFSERKTFKTNMILLQEEHQKDQGIIGESNIIYNKNQVKILPKIIRNIASFDIDTYINQKSNLASCKHYNEFQSKIIIKKLIKNQPNPFSEKISEIIEFENQINKATGQNSGNKFSCRDQQKH